MSNLKAFNQMIVAPNTQAYLQGVLGERKGEFINNITALVANNRQLQECEPLFLDAVPLSLEEIFIYELGGADYAVKDIIF